MHATDDVQRTTYNVHHADGNGAAARCCLVRQFGTGLAQEAVASIDGLVSKLIGLKRKARGSGGCTEGHSLYSRVR